LRTFPNGNYQYRTFHLLGLQCPVSPDSVAGKI